MASFVVAAIRLSALIGAIAVAASVLYAAVPAPAAAPSGVPATVAMAMTEAKQGALVRMNQVGTVSDLGGRTVVAFHVGQNGKPDSVRLVGRSHSLDLDRQSVRSVIATVCTACAGQDYLVSFDYGSN
jgi:hypothetical protein